jgi:hypothetical protein
LADQIVDIGDGFWNIRGSFRVGGLLDIGTQCSLVRRRSGGFLLLDAYTLTGPTLDRVRALTDGGRAIEAVLHLHPFHTVHVDAVAALFPDARHYGTERHHRKRDAVRWEREPIEHPDTHARFADDLELTVPPGVDFVPANEGLHFASVLAFHPASRTLHVDDTLTYVSVPLVGGLAFHPTLAKVLQKRPGAADELRAWAERLVARCADVDHLCTAHMRTLPPQGPGATPIAAQVQRALDKIDGTLKAHARRHG